ncbi:MAG: helix-turn-helix domain-containing protein [Eubacteriales bacterium]|nr:helix-turn-helix domain-containing protein [Eubacteriales bacterium]
MFEKEVGKLNQYIEAQPSVQYEKRIYTVDEIQDILGIGRNAAYELVKSGVFHSVHIGGSIRISKKSFDQWLDCQEDDCQVCESG